LSLFIEKIISLTTPFQSITGVSGLVRFPSVAIFCDFKIFDRLNNLIDKRYKKIELATSRLHQNKPHNHQIIANTHIFKMFSHILHI
jgi:hypothetical protein